MLHGVKVGVCRSRGRVVAQPDGLQPFRLDREHHGKVAVEKHRLEVRVRELLPCAGAVRKQRSRLRIVPCTTGENDGLERRA